MSTSRIASMALARIGQAKQIADLDSDQSAAGITCRLFYEPARDAVLADFPWPFAERTRSLALVTDGFSNEWRYAYRYPADCLRFRRIVGHAREGAVRLPYAVGGDASGRLILTDEPTAAGVYTERVTDTLRFPVLFESAVAWKLAVEIAPALSADPKWVTRAEQQYELALSTAETRALNESADDPNPDAEWVRARS